tara:strand:+ start:3551 stop:4270 length:720 start_codon:yes stop_codon:yes gene_type:complete
VFDAVAPFTCDGALFDGSNDFLDRDIAGDYTSNADSKVGCISFWVLMTAGSDGAAGKFFGITDGNLDIYRTAGNKLNIKLGTLWNAADSTTTITADAAWHHVAIAWDGGAATRQVYIDGSADATSFTGADANFNWTQADHSIGASVSGSQKLDAALAEIYINNETFLDLSTSVTKLRGADGKPVSLGGSGAAPTGAIPRVYLHLDDGQSANELNLNAGDGGNFDAVNGSLTTSASSPSD